MSKTGTRPAIDADVMRCHAPLLVFVSVPPHGVSPFEWPALTSKERRNEPLLVHDQSAFIKDHLKARVPRCGRRAVAVVRQLRSFSFRYGECIDVRVPVHPPWHQAEPVHTRADP